MNKKTFRFVSISVVGLILLIQVIFSTPFTYAQELPADKIASLDPPSDWAPTGLSPEEWDQILDQMGASYSQQAYLKASNADAEDIFGYSTAIWGDTIVVGAPHEASDGSGEHNNSVYNSGAAYIFVRVGSSWTQQAYLKSEYPGYGDNFGVSVDISGDTIVIGAPGEDSDGSGEENDDLTSAGAAYVFVREGTTWTQQAYLKASNVGYLDQFGVSVAISGDRIVVGANLEDSDGSGEENNSSEYAGAAYIFVREESTWTQQAYLKASNPDAEDYFGGHVAISWATVVIGASGEDSDGTGEANNDADKAGAAYVFVGEESTWSQQAYLKAPNVDIEDRFGTSVAIDGETLVVGAFKEDGDGSGQGNDDAIDSGAAYVFVRSGDAWTQQAYLKASNAECDDWFGMTVAIYGDTLVVGAYGEDSDGTGEENNDAEFASAAYVFACEGTTWTQQAYLKASNVDARDLFGYSVALWGHTIVVGAHAEDSDGSGEENNDAGNAGAAYVFRENEEPIADAGPDQSVDTLSQVNLDGSASSDPEGDIPLTYHWWQEWGTAVDLIGDDTATPSFIAPADPVTLVFYLVVTDSLGLASESDLVVIEVQGHKSYLPMITR